jgi:hypothetical protein
MLRRYLAQIYTLKQHQKSSPQESDSKTQDLLQTCQEVLEEQREQSRFLKENVAPTEAMHEVVRGRLAGTREKHAGVREALQEMGL